MFKRNRLKNALFLGGGRVTVSDRLDGSTQRGVAAENEEEEEEEEEQEEQEQEQEQKRGQRGGGGGTRVAVTLAATLATQKPPHRYRRAVGQAVAFTTELE